MLIFQGNDVTPFYQNLTPRPTTYAYKLFTTSKFMFMGYFSLLGALRLAITSVMVIGLQVALKLKNRYLAMLTPVLLLYLMNMVLEMNPKTMFFSLGMLMQPRVLSYYEQPIHYYHVVIGFLIVLGFTFISLIVGRYRAKAL